MSKPVAGVYKHGTIKLLETPTDVHEGRVLVTLEQAEGAESRKGLLQYGKYAGGRMSTEADFIVAEWHGD